MNQYLALLIPACALAILASWAPAAELSYDRPLRGLRGPCDASELRLGA